MCMETRIDRMESIINASGLATGTNKYGPDDIVQKDLSDEFSTLVFDEKGEKGGSKYIGHLTSTARSSARLTRLPGAGSASKVSLISPRGLE